VYAAQAKFAFSLDPRTPETQEKIMKRFLSLFVCLFALLIFGAGEAQACTPAPCMDTVEQVATGGSTDSGNGGNAWSGNRSRVVRTSTGTIYTLNTAPGTDSLHRVWQLYKRLGTNSWTMIASAPSGRDPAHILRGPNDELYIVSFIDGVPRVWTSTDGGTTFAAQDIPGSWETQLNTSYDGAGITPSGDVYVTQAYGVDGNKPGVYNYSYKSAGGQWAFKTQTFDFRNLYNYVLPTNAGAVNFVSVKTGLWTDFGYAGIPSAADGFKYVYKAVRSFYTPAVSSTPLSFQTVKEVVPNSQKNNYIHAFVSDAYRDIAGRVHVLYNYRDASTGSTSQSKGTYVGRQALLADDNSLINDAGLSMPCPDTTRQIQDTTGKFWTLSWCGGSFYVAGATDPDGLIIGSAASIALPYAPDNVPHLAAPRGGSVLQDYVHGTYAANNGATWVYFRLRLR
jgi:hypothetical protein